MTNNELKDLYQALERFLDEYRPNLSTHRVVDIHCVKTAITEQYNPNEGKDIQV